MTVQDNIEGQTGLAGEAYEPPKLTKFGTIEEWTRGALDGVSISIIL